MRFEISDGPIHCVAEMDIGRDEFIFGVPGVFNDIFVSSTCFVITELELHYVPGFCQPLSG